MTKKKRQPAAGKQRLTGHQRKFCDLYLLCMNGSKAAIEAGYAAGSARVTASKLLTKTNIQDYLDERRKHEEEIVGISRIKNLKQLAITAERALEPGPVYDMFGNPVFTELEEEVEEDGKKVKKKLRAVIARDNPKALVSSLSELNKMMGYHAPEKYDHTTKGEKIDRVEVTIVRPKHGENR